MKCLACGSNKLKLKYVIKHFKYYECRFCKCLNLDKLNADGVNYSHFSYDNGFMNELRIRKRAKNIVEDIKRLQIYPKKVLDVGCGAGFLLDVFKDKYTDVVGIEPSVELSDSARKLGLKVVTGYLSNRNINKIKTKFDLIIVSHVIEHIFLPKEFIDLLSKLLEKNGFLYIETPNIRSNLALIEKENYTFLTPPEHVCLYSDKGIKELFQFGDKRFKIIKQYSFSDPEHIMGILRKIKLSLFGRNHISLTKTHKENTTVDNNKNDKVYLRDIIIPKLIGFFFNLFDRGSYLVYYIKLT